MRPACKFSCSCRSCFSYFPQCMVQVFDADCTPALQVSLHVITMAFVVVLCTCGLLIPVMLYVFQVCASCSYIYSTTMLALVLPIAAQM